MVLLLAGFLNLAVMLRSLQVTSRCAGMREAELRNVLRFDKRAVIAKQVDRQTHILFPTLSFLLLPVPFGSALIAPLDPFPVPASLNPACGFPVLGFPVCFLSRLCGCSPGLP